MSIIEFLSQPLWQRLGLTLVHFLWQGLAIAIFIYACVRVFKLSHGNARYIVYLLAFAAMIVCPVVTFITINIPISPDVELFVEIESAEPFDIASGTVPPEGAISPKAGTSIPAIPKLTPVTNTIPIGERIYSYLHNTMPWLLVIWIVGVIVLSMRLLMGFIGVHRWRHHLEQLPERLVQRIASLSEELGMRGFSRVFISPSVLQAMAVGYLRPMVLLPASMVTQMKPEMLEAVIAHELAHIRRFDLWVNLAQRVMETLLFYHPAVWWLSSCLRSERELCCDELAVRATGERLTYASALESVVRAKLIAKQPTLAVGLNQDNKPILRRVRHILGLVPTRRNHPFWIAGIITVLFLIILTISTILVLANKTRSVADSEAVRTANSEDVSATIPKPVTLNEFIKGWPGQGTMNIRAASPTVAQRQEADMMDSTIGVILSTLREGPAKEAGLQVGDYIVRIADTDVRSNHHLIALTRAMSPGSKVNVEFVRKGKKMAVDVVLGPLEWSEDYPILAGNVLLPNGQPAIEAMVYARVYYDRGSRSDALPYLTDKLGRFIAKFSSRYDLGRCFLLATSQDGFAGYTIVDFPTKAPIDIQLKKGKITKGRLFTDKGEGIPDILMEVEGIAVPGEKLKFGMYPELRTDRKGYFNLPALPVGSRVQLNFEVAGYAHPSRGPYDLTQIENGFLFGEEGIPLGASIEGVVLSSNIGKAIGSFSLSWRNASVNISKSIQVDTEGRFKADTLPSGETSFYIGVSEMRKLGYSLTQKVLNLNPGEKVIDLQLTAEPFGIITGKITDRKTKQGLADFTVTARNEAFAGDMFKTTTLADGTYRLPIPAGNVWFTFREARNYKLRVKPGQEIDGVDFVGEAVNGLSEKKIIVRLLDLNGLPVSSVRVGKYWSNSDEIQGRPYLNFNYVPSDEEGLVQFQKDDLFRDRNQNERLLLYALVPSQKLAGFTEISQQDTDRVIDWQLQPACRVNGRLESSSLEKLEQTLGWTNVYVYKDNYRPLSYSSKAGQFEFFLPPGSYKLRAYGTSTYSINSEIEINRGQKELEVKLDLPADRLSTLIGKTAPEFRNIKGWINSEPLKLANLRGKLVLLDFWGYWCGPCIAAMPNLMQLHDKFSKHGLIIIAIHDDSLGSIEELQQKLKVLSEERWSGWQIPFAIALDGGGEKKIEGTDRSARGATSAAYGIQAWPTSILIDRDGNIVKKFHPSNPDAIEELQDLLGVQFINQLSETGQVMPTGWVGGVIKAKGLGSDPTMHLIRTDNNIGLWNLKNEFTRIVQRTYNISDLVYSSGAGVFVGDTTGGKIYYKRGSDPGYSGEYGAYRGDDGGGMLGHVIIANQTIVNAAQNIVNLIVETIEPNSWYINNDEALGTIFSYPAERPRMLAVHQIPAVHQKIEKLLESLRVPQPQVSIEMCYLYAGEEFFNEIKENMDIEFNLDTFLDDTQVISLLRAFQKNNDAKRLTAPKVTVLNNETAQYSLRRNFVSFTEYSKPKTVLKSSSPAPINIFCRITPHVKDDNNNVIIDLIQDKIKVPATEITTITNKVIPYGKTFSFPCAISKLDQDDQVTSPEDKKKLIILIKPTIIQPEQAVEAEPLGSVDSDDDTDEISPPPMSSF